MSDTSIRKGLKGVRKKTLVKERRPNGNKKLEALFSILFFLGLILLYWEILIYRRTIIEIKIPLLIWLTPGILLTPLLYDKFNKIDGMRAHWLLHYVAHTCMTGAFLLFGFMASNYYFADNQTVDKRFEIVRKGSLPGPKGHRSKREPYVEIVYKGFEKQLVFKYSDTKKIDAAQYVNLTVKKGVWGFDILERYDAK
ncbi:hypothetical protein [Mangrovibacterium diazotrophicum]|uniref:Uncharacterized protein n=1 Tax=Mangrovibacterium diazotrophicum TaxID=1261403 RepID=A0A419VX01_9BACT|nr:hypothetical protein [Mangrovibacterium diazotrophicum]RKD87765.1 hypothetical protein BC643_3772 [Mangrovibacterium diazotrophicum]